MKTIPQSVQNHLSGSVTHMVYCWKVSRKDGVTLGFTEHDRDLLFDSVRYEASTGFFLFLHGGKTEFTSRYF